MRERVSFGIDSDIYLPLSSKVMAGFPIPKLLVYCAYILHSSFERFESTSLLTRAAGEPTALSGSDPEDTDMCSLVFEKAKDSYY